MHVYVPFVNSICLQITQIKTFCFLKSGSKDLRVYCKSRNAYFQKTYANKNSQVQTHDRRPHCAPSRDFFLFLLFIFLFRLLPSPIKCIAFLRVAGASHTLVMNSVEFPGISAQPYRHIVYVGRKYAIRHAV